MIFQGASVADVAFELEGDVFPEGDSTYVLVRRVDLSILLTQIDNLEFELSRSRGTAQHTHPVADLFEALNRRAD